MFGQLDSHGNVSTCRGGMQSVTNYWTRLVLLGVELIVGENSYISFVHFWGFFSSHFSTVVIMRETYNRTNERMLS